MAVTVPQSIIQAPAEIAPVLAKPTAKKVAVTLKLIVLVVVAALSIFGIMTAVDFYHRSQSTILFNAGTDEYAKGNHDGALADFNKVIRYRPDFADAYNVRGLTKYSIADYAGAMADFNKVIELQPNFPDVYCNRGNVEYSSGDLDGAFADYNKAIEFNTADAVLYFNRALVEDAKGHYNSALTDYKKAVELKPDFAKAINSRDALTVEQATPVDEYIQQLKPWMISHMNASHSEIQQLVERIHGPTITFLDADIIGMTAQTMDGSDRAGKEGNNIAMIDMIVNCRWKGWIQSSGYTQMEFYFDNQRKKLGAPKFLNSNAALNIDTIDWGDVALKLGVAFVDYEQSKSQ